MSLASEVGRRHVSDSLALPSLGATMAIGSIALLSCALILPMHPLVRPRSPQCMMKSYDTSKPYDSPSSPEPLGEEEEELMATLVEPAEAEPAAVEPAADDTAAIGDDEQELLMALRRARARGGVAGRAG